MSGKSQGISSVVPIDAYFSSFHKWYFNWDKILNYVLIQISFAKWFFLNFICFHVLHNVRHKVSTIFMMLKTFSCADLFSRPLCWSIYWRIMWLLCGLECIAKNHHGVCIATVTGICVGSQGNVREKSGNVFLATPWQPCKPKPKPSTYDTRTTTPWQRSKFRYLDRSQSNKYAINMQIQTISVSK